VANKSKIIIHSLRDESGDNNNSNLLLWQLKPEFVILYDNDLSFVRALEVYHSYYHQKSLRVYLLAYTNSTDLQSYYSIIRREKNCFLRLIEEKSQMIFGQNAEGKIDTSVLTLPSQLNGCIDTKSKRSQVRRHKQTQRVIVDLREFRNSTSLPLLLYRDGINVIPVTLKVGDYILSPSLCVERKCVPDLFSSMMHGRLYDQILQMERYYETAILLIEFSKHKSFSLQNVKDIPAQISLNNIISKLVITTIHFHKLSIVWSRCPLITTKIFKSLKAKRDEPNVDDSVNVTNDAQTNEDNEDIHTPKDILGSLPGINHKNVKKILAKCESLRDVCSKSKEEIHELLGVKDGNLLYTFLHNNFFA